MFPRIRSRQFVLAGALALVLSLPASADVTVAGRIVDLNGQPLPGSMVSLRPGGPDAGATYVSVFAGSDGRFAFPEPVASVASLTVRSLDHEQIEPIGTLPSGTSNLTIVMQTRLNQTSVAPASAWLAGADRDDKAYFVRDCIGCHQVLIRGKTNGVGNDILFFKIAHTSKV